MNRGVPGTTQRSMKFAGLFAGIGGIELGLQNCGHESLLLVEIDKGAQQVLRTGFPDLAGELLDDIRDVRSLPASTELLAAGFPCQDLSQAGKTKGIGGERSGLVGEVLRLATVGKVPWLLLENVPFMLQLNSGEAMQHIIDALENLGYAWAYRIVDTRSFGLPQRRERLFLIASRCERPSRLLFQDEAAPVLPDYQPGTACGFYWTEGTRGLGWAVDAIPTLKGGSTVGIPSPPAIWLPDGSIVTPDLRDAERLQGFPPDWTRSAEQVYRATFRWKLVGNAVSVPVADWLGDVLSSMPGDLPDAKVPLSASGRWPRAAFGEDGKRFAVRASAFPVVHKSAALQDFLKYEPKPLSLKATQGFTRRLTNGSLRYPEAFLTALNAHIEAQNGQPIWPAAHHGSVLQRPLFV